MHCVIRKKYGVMWSLSGGMQLDQLE
jgi:hypothetical protein